MRVIAGSRRSIRLTTVKGDKVRPTTDRIKETLFNILQPDLPGASFLDLFSGSGFDLILSGHMHGGQVRIPGVGGVVSPKSNFMQKDRIIFPKYFGGEYSIGNTKIVVSRGIGNPTILPRVFNRPEICSITLKSK